MPKMPQFMAVMPIAVLLTTSFFVLVVNRKIEEKGVKVFGYCVAGFLWLAAIIVLAGAAFGFGKAVCAGKKYSHSQRPAPIMQQGNLPAAEFPKPALAVKETRSSSCSSCAGNKGAVTKTR